MAGAPGGKGKEEWQAGLEKESGTGRRWDNGDPISVR